MHLLRMTMKDFCLPISISNALFQDIEDFPAQSPVDLHIHSNWSSDGEYGCLELFAAAKILGMSHLVVADHDTMSHIPGALEAGKLFNIRTMPALELSTVDENRMVHVLAYGFDQTKDSTLKNMIDQVAKSRWDIFFKIAGRLREESFYFEDEKVLELAGGKPPVITNFAQAILEDERNNNNKALHLYRPGGKKADVPNIRFINDYLVPGKKCNVPEYQITLADGISAIHDSGGTAIIAHPGQWFVKKDELKLKDLISRGLAGFEVYTPYHNSEKTTYFKELCERFDLIGTGGSDFHSLSRKPGHHLGQSEGVTTAIFDRLL